MNLCRICNSTKTKLKFVYKSKPKGETDFNIDKKKYYREFFECTECGHMFSNLSFEMSNFYDGEYTEFTYGKNLFEKFKKIIDLPLTESDNENRFLFLKKEAKKLLNIKNIKILDVGSGLGVFPWRAKKENWAITALDPDPKNIEHIRKNLGVRAIKGNFLTAKIFEKFNIITFNKVIEHVEDPFKMINKTKLLTKNKSFIYVEVPDVKAAKSGKNREEFFIEHFHVFSEKSINILANNSGMICLTTQSLIEPSGKFTLRAIFICKG